MSTSEHSCTLTPSFLTLDLAPISNVTFPKAVVGVLEVTGDIPRPPLLLIQFVLQSKVKKVSQTVA